MRKKAIGILTLCALMVSLFPLKAFAGASQWWRTGIYGGPYLYQSEFYNDPFTWIFGGDVEFPFDYNKTGPLLSEIRMTFKSGDYSYTKNRSLSYDGNLLTGYHSDYRTSDGSIEQIDYSFQYSEGRVASVASLHQFSVIREEGQADFVTKIQNTAKRAADGRVLSTDYTWDFSCSSTMPNETASKKSRSANLVYEYDELGRLTKDFAMDGTSPASYSYLTEDYYDASGRQIIWDAHHFKNGQMIEEKLPMTYDEKGRLISDGDRTYRYDNHDHLTEIKYSNISTTTHISYVYNGDKIKEVHGDGYSLYYDDNEKIVKMEFSNNVDKQTWEYSYIPRQ